MYSSRFARQQKGELVSVGNSIITSHYWRGEMFGLIKKMFGKAEATPPGFTPVDDAMSNLAGATAAMISMQLVMSGLDDDPGNWIRDERATVMGYIDGQITLLYPEGDPRVPLASILTCSIIFQNKRTDDQIFREREYFVSEGEATFMRAAQQGWEDAKASVSKDRGQMPLGLVELLNPTLRGS